MAVLRFRDGGVDGWEDRDACVAGELGTAPDGTMRGSLVLPVPGTEEVATFQNHVEHYLFGDQLGLVTVAGCCERHSVPSPEVEVGSRLLPDSLPEC